MLREVESHTAVGEILCRHQSEVVAYFVVVAFHQAPHISLNFMLDFEVFVSGAAITFLWGVTWYGLVVEQDVIAELFFTQQYMDPGAGNVSLV